jgi:hypothetical protein
MHAWPLPLRPGEPAANVTTDLSLQLEMCSISALTSVLAFLGFVQFGRVTLSVSPLIALI